jgi:putative ABC transport system permease protein
MNWVAIRMLTGDTTKYIGIVFGVAFAALLMGQQLAIFCGLMRNTTSQVRDIDGGDIWVMDKNVQFVDDVKPMSENKLLRVRGVPGVKWAVRLYKGIARGKLSNGNFQQLIVIGLDDATLVGAPTPERIVHGNLNDLRQPNAVFIDEFGWRYLYQDEPFAPGKTLEMNDRRAVIVGMCKCNPTFQTFPILYCTYSQAVQFVPQERKTLTFILAKADETVTPEELCPRITEQTNLKALTNDEFFWTTIRYYLQRTGIPINFGITVMLGFVVGCAIAGQTFYLFTIENIKQFGALKAMGVSNFRLIGMIMLQALLVGVIGYGLGIGGAAAFGYVFENFVKSVPPAFYFGWQIPTITAGAVTLIITFSALMSMRRVLFLEAGVVFR